MIYHVTTGQAWQLAQKTGFYTTDSFEQEGFIHCCRPEQLEGVLKRYYAQAPDLLVLYLDESRLTAPLKWEPSPVTNELFPHVYGAINLEAVQTIQAIVR